MYGWLGLPSGLLTRLQFCVHFLYLGCICAVKLSCFLKINLNDCPSFTFHGCVTSCEQSCNAHRLGFLLHLKQVFLSYTCFLFSMRIFLMITEKEVPVSLHPVINQMCSRTSSNLELVILLNLQML